MTEDSVEDYLYPEFLCLYGKFIKCGIAAEYGIYAKIIGRIVSV